MADTPQSRHSDGPAGSIAVQPKGAPRSDKKYRRHGDRGEQYYLGHLLHIGRHRNIPMEIGFSLSRNGSFALVYLLF
jgi:hypothetical protein